MVKHFYGKAIKVITFRDYINKHGCLHRYKLGQEYGRSYVWQTSSLPQSIIFHKSTPYKIVQIVIIYLQLVQVIYQIL